MKENEKTSNVLLMTSYLTIRSLTIRNLTM